MIFLSSDKSPEEMAAYRAAEHGDWWRWLGGVSGGAALGVTLIATLGLATWIGEAIGGFLGALGALLLVAALSTRNGRLKPLDMLLVGVVFNAFAGAMLLFLESFAAAEAVQRVLLRLMGSLAYDPSQPLLIPALGATAVVAAIFLARSAGALNLLALGDTTAESLGVRPHRLRATLFVVLSLPIGAVVAVSGMIGFVGLIVPHAVRLVLGPDHRLLIPASALVGAIFVLVADGAVRLLAGPLDTELPVGVMTAALGGPVFVVLLRRSRQGGWL